MTTNIDFPVKFYVRESFSNGTTITVPTAWVRDHTITGNPLHLYLFLVSRNSEGVVALDDAQKALGLSDEDFKAAYLTLADHGYLLRVVDDPTRAFEYPGVTYFTRVRIAPTDITQAERDASEGQHDE